MLTNDEMPDESDAARQKLGRPGTPETKRTGYFTTTIRLTREQAQVLNYVGEGSRSRGIRKLIEMYVRLASVAQNK